MYVKSILPAIVLVIAFANASFGDAMTSDVTAYGSMGQGSATAAHGFIDGNDSSTDNGFVPKKGQPLLEYLNNGTSNFADLGRALPTLDGSEFSISASGMFSTETNNGSIIDLTDGTEITNSSWTFLGKKNSDDQSWEGDGDDIFESIPNGTTGSLSLKLGQSLSGNFVISLKASNQFAVYAFANAFEVDRFDFKLTNGHGLSHVSVYQGDDYDPDLPSSTPSVPEPSTFALVALGLAGLASARRRR